MHSLFKVELRIHVLYMRLTRGIESPVKMILCESRVHSFFLSTCNKKYENYGGANIWIAKNLEGAESIEQIYCIHVV